MFRKPKFFGILMLVGLGLGALDHESSALTARPWLSPKLCFGHYSSIFVKWTTAHHLDVHKRNIKNVKCGRKTKIRMFITLTPGLTLECVGDFEPELEQVHQRPVIDRCLKITNNQI